MAGDGGDGLSRHIHMMCAYVSMCARYTHMRVCVRVMCVCVRVKRYWGINPSPRHQRRAGTVILATKRDRMAWHNPSLTRHPTRHHVEEEIIE